MTNSKQNDHELAERIRQARLDMNKSQLQVGVALGVSDKTVSGYESGRISPPVTKLMAMAEYFKKPVSYFLGADPKEYKVSARLRAVETALKEIKSQIDEIKAYARSLDLDQ